MSKYPPFHISNFALLWSMAYN